MICNYSITSRRFLRAVNLLESSVVVKGSKLKDLQVTIIDLTICVFFLYTPSPFLRKVYRVKKIFCPFQISKATDSLLEVDSELADALEDIKEYTGNKKDRQI